MKFSKFPVCHIFMAERINRVFGDKSGCEKGEDALLYYSIIDNHWEFPRKFRSRFSLTWTCSAIFTRVRSANEVFTSVTIITNKQKIRKINFKFKISFEWDMKFFTIPDSMKTKWQAAIRQIGISGFRIFCLFYGALKCPKFFMKQN